MKKIRMLMATIAVALLPCSVAEAAPTVAAKAAPAGNVLLSHTGAMPKVIDLGKLGKYRVTNIIVNGQPAIRADRITKKAHAAAPYLHEANASSYCIAWNNQAATDNIRYVEASLGRYPYYLYSGSIGSTRYSNTYLAVTDLWTEGQPHDLRINYVCWIYGSDQAMTMYSIQAGSVYWAWA